jgi:hypothetical protein
MTWTIPDKGEGENDLQSVVCQSSLDALLAGHRRTGVFSGCAVSQRAAGANMSVDVASGVVALAGVTAAVASGNVAIGAADATNPRLDLVVSDGSGTKSVIAGTAAAAPKEATLDTTTYILLAQVYVPAAATTITTARIYDRRVDVKLPSRSTTDTHTDLGPVNTVTETVVASQAIPTTIAAGDVVKLHADGDSLNNSGSSATVTLKAIIGGTTVVTSTAVSMASGANRRSWQVEIDVLVVATNDQRLVVEAIVTAAGTATWGMFNNSFSGAGDGTATEDLTAGKNLQLSATLSAANASLDFVCHKSWLEVIKR